jgi:hypothetical protein
VTERVRLAAATLLVGALGFGYWYAATSAGGTGAENSVEEIQAAAEAVRAWGVFAATGDLDPLSDWFATDGPQYSQLASEVPHIVPGSVREFEFSQAELLGAGLVRGSVTVTGGGGDQQDYRWDIELIQRDGRWKVWTVRTSSQDQPRR